MVFWKRVSVAIALVLGLAGGGGAVEIGSISSVVLSARGAGETAGVQGAGSGTPALASSFAGPFNGFAPDDPVIAAGPSNLVVGTNQGIAIVEKNGTISAVLDLFSFCSSSYDPKLTFDPHAGRFLFTALSGDLICLAVSKTDTPHNLASGPGPGADWWTFQIDGHDEAMGMSPRTTPDFEGLGVDQHNVYITANMYSPTGFLLPEYVKVFVVPKTGLLAGGSITVHAFGSPPGPPLSNPVTGMKNLTIMPSINHDATPQHMIATPLETEGSLGRSTLWTVNNPAGSPSLVSSDLLLPSWTGAIHVDCGQRDGGYNIDSGFVGTVSAVERSGSLWAAHTAPVGGVRSEIHWYEIDASGPSILQSGQVSDPQHCYFYPAIQPDREGNVALVMSGVDPTIYPSAFYTARLASDPPGTMRPVGVLQEGLGNYSVYAPPQRNRWGDYGGISDDPATGGIWMIHHYTRGVNDAATWIGELRLAGPASGMGHALFGRLLLVRDPKPGSDPSRRRVVVQARDSVTVAAIAGDPIANGATLTINLEGATPSSQTFFLPPGARSRSMPVGWERLKPSGFRYRDPLGANGPIDLVRFERLRNGAVRLKLAGFGYRGPLDLIPPDPGVSAEVRLAIEGDGDRLCASFGAAAGGTVKRNDAESFKVVETTAKGDCP